jgi:hypothetical protein
MGDQTGNNGLKISSREIRRNEGVGAMGFGQVPYPDTGEA